MDSDGLELDHTNEAPWCDLDLFRRVLPEIESHPSRIVQQYFSHYIHFDRSAVDPSSSSAARDSFRGCVYVYEALLSLPPHMFVISKKSRGRAAAAEDVTIAVYLILDGFVFQCASLASVVHARACQMGHFSREALDALERSSSWDPFEGNISKGDRACACVSVALSHASLTHVINSNERGLRRAAAVYVGCRAPRRAAAASTAKALKVYVSDFAAACGKSKNQRCARCIWRDSLYRTGRFLRVVFRLCRWSGCSNSCWDS
jgi:hypothetical protein